jgi:hypothetical protein
MHNYHRDFGAPRCAFKIDIQKAYDTVDWSFMHKVLTGFGFHQKMIGWIMACISSTSFSISVNGEIHGYFKGVRGLRQGDPLSPYLFTMVMEILTLILQQDVAFDASFRFHSRCEKQRIINLCFADDLFLFAYGDRRSVDCLLIGLSKFSSMSGLIPNIQKSTVFFSNVPEIVRMYILTTMPFAEGQLPVRYLGVPLISSRLVYRDCSVLLEALDTRILSWKNRFLSFAGRLQLIKSVLLSMHIYWCSVFMLPARIVKELESKMTGFLWCQGKLQTGKAKVSWKAICAPKGEGGLGIRRIRDMNKALLASLIWRLISRQKSLWVAWVYSYHLHDRTFWNYKQRNNCCWSWRKLCQLRPVFRQHFWYLIGDGSQTNAWYDQWDKIGPLGNVVTTRDIYRAGFSITSTVADLFVQGVWSLPIEWGNKYAVIKQVRPPIIHLNESDQVQWSVGDVLHQFSVNIAWDAIRTRNQEFRWKHLIWFSQCIPKHAFVLWLILREKLVTHDKIRVWNYKRNDMSLLCCLLCYSEEETHNHLFFNCKYSSRIWDLACLKKGVLLVAPYLTDMADGILKLGMRSATSVISRLMVAAIVYHIWRERNQRFVNNHARPPELCLTLFLKMSDLNL